MLRPGGVALRIRDPFGFGERKNQLRLPARDIQAPDACVVWNPRIKVWIGNARITVAGTAIVQPAKVGIDRRLAVWAQCVDRSRKGPLSPGFEIHYPTYKLPVLPVIPDDVCFRAGNPLQHTALLPVPCRGLA